MEVSKSILSQPCWVRKLGAVTGIIPIRQTLICQTIQSICHLWVPALLVSRLVSYRSGCFCRLFLFLFHMLILRNLFFHVSLLHPADVNSLQSVHSRDPHVEFLKWQNPEQLFVAQELINKVKSKCCGIKDEIN